MFMLENDWVFKESLNSLDINPNYAKSYFQYGLLLIKLEDIEEAKNNFDKVTEIDQNFAQAYFNKAKLLTNPDDFEDAKKNYETALDIDEEYLEANYYLAKLHYGGKATDKEGTIDRKSLKRQKSIFKGSGDRPEASQILLQFSQNICRKK